jgi:GNAT superfamily N-acetyltransferase
VLKPGEADAPPGPGALGLRPGTTADAEAIRSLQVRELGRDLVAERARGLIQDFPSVVLDEDDELAGFAYSVELAPDILQLANLLIARRLRGAGLGAAILSELERVASPRYASIIAVNSSLYAPFAREADAGGFYAAAGYELVHETSRSRIFAKAL